MVASTTVMGGAVAWATGSDFLQGAMQGMKIGLFNHAMHDGDGDIKYYHDKNGNIRGEISEVVVVSSRHTSYNLLGVAVGMNTILDGIGTSLKKMVEIPLGAVIGNSTGIQLLNEGSMAISM